MRDRVLGKPRSRNAFAHSLLLAVETPVSRVTLAQYFKFVRDDGLGKPRSLDVSLLHSQHQAAGTKGSEPCVTLVQRPPQHQWKPRGGVRTVAQLGPQLSLQLGVVWCWTTLRRNGHDGVT